MKVIHNPKCSKSRAMIHYLNEKKISFDTILYLEQGLTRSLLLEILEKTKLPILDLIRTGEEEYKTAFKNKDFSTDEWITILIQHPKLLQRPIVINHEQAIIGRPLENILPLL